MATLNIFSLEQMLHLVGVLSVLWLILKALWILAGGVRTHLLSEVWKGVDLSSYGPWAVVTGATAGIGKAYAHELARRGLNVVLISRSLEKLKQVAAEIEEQHGRSTRVIQADLTRGSEIYEPIRAALQGLEIGILDSVFMCEIAQEDAITVSSWGDFAHEDAAFCDVPAKVNNVGLSFQKPTYFLDGACKSDQHIHDFVHCNMLSFIKMTQIILPQMVARKKGIIINMSSTSGIRPFPLGLLYGATKTFDDFFSQSLDVEYRSKGIIVQTVMPLFVDSNMTHQVNRYCKLSAPSFARQALNTVGLSSRTTGSLSHSIQSKILLGIIPEWFQASPLVISVTLFLWKKVLKASK